MKQKCFAVNLRKNGRLYTPHGKSGEAFEM